MRKDMMILAAGAALVLAACEEPQPESPQASEPVSYDSVSVAYACEGGAEVQAVYFNFADGQALAVLHHDGTLAPMRIMPSASGAKYTSLDEALGWRWHTKGGEASLSYMAPDHTAEEEVVLSGCRDVTQGE
ncbi:MliC family protein [Tepidicaulis sp. LMO-SS28]|uniref:MliC family protein n=1 Tax=Tepidicaulis sp. LMO-SS28 TaxID=3447455 RepID=UPI003EE14814